jgi:hypothetical protein
LVLAAAVTDISAEVPSYFCRFLWDGLYDVYYPNVDPATLGTPASQTTQVLHFKRITYRCSSRL